MEKPVFVQNDRVIFIVDGHTAYRGRIVGLASEHIVNFWIVEADEESQVRMRAAGYNFSCFVASGPLYKDEP